MEEFEGWLQANEAHYPRLTFAVSELGGRGGIATEDIQPGEELCSIPVRLVLTTEIARKSEVGRLVATHLNAVQGERLRVSAGRAILCAYLIHQRAAQDAFWGPYLRSLPSTFSTPLYWPDEDIQHLAGTNLFYAMQEKQQQIRESFDLLFPALCHAHPTVFPPDLFTWEHFLWAFTACSSRSFPQTLVQQPTAATSAHADPYDLLEIDECLLPGLDMLNHQYRKKITWALDPSTGRLRFVTEDTVEKGTEAFNNYGPKGNEELLMGYGFCIEDNEQDYVMIRLSFSPADPLAARKKALLGRLKLPVLQALRRDYVPPALLDALRVSVMTQWELYFFDADELDDDSSSSIADDGMTQRKRKRIETEGGPTPAGENGSVFVNWRNELEMTQTLKGLLEDKVRKLGPGPQALTATHNNGNVRNATIYKNGQRRVLNSCIEAVGRMISETARRANAASLAQIDSAAARAEPTTAYAPPPGIDHLLRFTSDGVFAAQDVPAGQALLTIPRQLLITVDTALESPLGEALQYVEGGLDEDTVLTLFLVWEKGRGEASPWYPFLSAVRHKQPAPTKNKKKSTTATKTKAPARKKPAAQKRTAAKEEKAMELVEEAGGGGGGDETKDKAGEEDGEWAGEVDLPLAWTKEERSLLGPDFETASQLGETEEGLKELYSQLFPALSQALPQYFPRAHFSWANFRWASMVLDSHSVRVAVPPPASAADGVDADKMMAVDNGVPDEEEEEEEEEEESEAGGADATALSAGPTTITVVLPLAVLPRHHPYACTVAALGSSAGEGLLTLHSLAPVAEGDPIHLAVGRGPTSAELMLRRGRIAGTADANPFDALRFPFPAQIPLTHAKLALLQRLGLEDDIRARSHFLRGHGPLPAKLIDTLRVIFLPDDAVERLLATASAGGLLALPTDVDAQVAALIEGSLRSLLSGLTAAGPETTGAKGRKLRRTQRAREYLAAQRHIVTHNLTQLAGWSRTKQ